MEFTKQSEFPNEYKGQGQDNTISSKILDIMRLALEINPPTIDDIGSKKTAVFVWWSPHCPLINVQIYVNGWDEENTPDEGYSIYTAADGAAEKLDEIIERLYDLREGQND